MDIEINLYSIPHFSLQIFVQNQREFGSMINWGFENPQDSTAAGKKAMHLFDMLVLSACETGLCSLI